MPKERNKADDYREKAYAGDTKAMNNLGVCYERGTGVKVSLELAFEWYMKAAELDDVYGCFNVGECYYHGKGVEQDQVLAFEWYMKAADKGDMQSQVNVANAYYLGNGVEMDHTRHSCGIARPLSKDTSCHRRTAELPTGMVTA